MKHYSIQTNIHLADARRMPVKHVRPKPRVSKIKLPLDDAQAMWLIRVDPSVLVKSLCAE
jgi:hypothetical protein